MSDIEDYERDDLDQELEELMNKLELINTTFLYPKDKNDPRLVQYKEGLIAKIRALRKRFGFDEHFDTTVGFEPFKHIMMRAFI